MFVVEDSLCVKRVVTFFLEVKVMNSQEYLFEISFAQGFRKRSKLLDQTVETTVVILVGDKVPLSFQLHFGIGFQDVLVLIV